MRTFTLPVGTLGFDVLADGPADGPVVLLLHGFPQTARSFAEVLPRLAAAGLRAVAVTQRGYSPAARTDAVADYTPAALADDVLGVADALGADRFHVVGHDLGGLVAWQLAGTPGERVASATVLSTPHPAAWTAALLRSTQLLQSAYIPVFQLPVVPELLLGAHGGLLLRHALERSGLPRGRAASYVRSLLDGGGLRHAFHWYRALRPGAVRTIPAAVVPTTYVWGDGDVALGRAAAESTGAHVEGEYRFAVLRGISHWLPEAAPAQVADLVIDRVLQAGGELRPT